jgi:hypothetical protein
MISDEIKALVQDKNSATNLQADPRVTVTIWNRKNPYCFAEIRGRVVQTVGGPEERWHARHSAIASAEHDAQPDGCRRAVPAPVAAG